ncbi:hypothetical protein [Cupriavidus basilensis]|uniref:hypothetical protein n=1 Tax=Cupriavidus basilensis TaxID=68895 RepID=UPI00157B52A0|nr:hypothetical protein [Cupriavidus basilensis]NUA27137.1 hypothetical protein [Cupriavidus basilensis]
MVLSAWALVGCATQELSLNSPFALNADETLVLVAARLRNTREPRYPIGHLTVTFDRSRLMFTTSGSGTEAATATVGPADSQTFLIAAKVKAGKNEMTWLSGRTDRTPALGFGLMLFGVSAPFTAMPGKVQYLGFLDIENVDRKNESQQSTATAGQLVDQIITGLAKGTLAIRLSDESQRDIARFRHAFPALVGHDIQVAPLQQITLEPHVIKPAHRQTFEPLPEPEIVVLERAATR